MPRLARPHGVCREGRGSRLQWRIPGASKAGLLALIGLLGLSLPAHGQSAAASDAGSKPADPAAVRAACISNHEQTQVLKLESKLLAAQEAARGCARPECPGVLQADCVRWLEELGQEVPSVVLTARSDSGDEADVVVLANGERLTERLDGRPIQLDPGPYTLRFELAGSEPVEVRVVLHSGEQRRLVSADFTTEKPEPAGAGATTTSATTTPPPPPRERYRPVPTATYVLGAAALATAGGAVFFGLSARSDHQDAMDDCAPVCDGSEVSSIRRKAVVADVLAGAAVVSAGLATVLYFLEPEQTRPAEMTGTGSHWPRWGVGATSHGAFVDLRGRF